LSYPVGNRAARNDLTRVRLLRRQQSVLLNQLKEEVRIEIRAALRQIEVSDKIVDVTRTGRRLAEEKLDNLLKRQKVGLATTRDVLEGEQDLAAANFDETAALADYNNAVTDYLRISGLLLEQAGVRFIAQVRKDEDGPLLGMETP
jgi:outer membrane protein TolC